MGGIEHRLEARTLGIERKHCVFAQTVGESRAAIVVGMRVRVRMDASLGANLKRAHVGVGGRAHAAAKGAHVGGGIN